MAELAHTCTSGDEVTADNVLLHTLEVVGLARDGGFVEHLGRFLEGSGGHETLGLESCAGDTLKNLGGGGGDWEVVESILKDLSEKYNVDVYVYSLEGYVCR